MWTIARTTYGQDVTIEVDDATAAVYQRCGVRLFPTKEEAEANFAEQRRKARQALGPCPVGHTDCNSWNACLQERERLLYQEREMRMSRFAAMTRR